jgi:hypothetical protein
MSIRITLAVAALGTVLASEGYTRDVSSPQRHVRPSDLERSFTVPRNADDTYYTGTQYFRQCSDSPARC